MRPSLLRRFPVVTQAVTTGALFAVGDVVAQELAWRLNDKRDRVANPGSSPSPRALDWRRLAAMTTFGCFVAGPAMFGWYRVLERHVRASTPARRLVACVALDQFVFAPTFIGIFFMGTGLLKGEPVAVVESTLRENYWRALTSNYAVWPWVQLVNFHFVPLHLRATVVNTLAIGWNSYMSWLASSRVHRVKNDVDDVDDAKRVKNDVE